MRTACVVLFLAGCSCGPAESSDGGADGGSSAFVAVSAEAHTNCALRDDGVAVCWGFSFAEPLVVMGVDEVAAGWNQACFRRGESVECVPAPFDVMWSLHDDVPSGPFAAIDSGLNVTCGLRPSGEVDCWGWDETVTGVEIPPPLREPALDIHVAEDHACIVTASSRATCWSPIPRGGWLVDLPAGTYREAASGYGARCALSEAGEVICAAERCWMMCSDHVCAEGEVGGVEVCADDLGVDDTGATIRWMERVGEGPGGSFVRLATSATGLFLCGLRESGALECWGEGYEPLRPLAPAGALFRDAAAGGAHVCGVTTDGELLCWGLPIEGDWGQTRAPALP